ncbi:hypothetical protein C8A03DRAFT_11841 [Achaetomium macrosporum]|uniref:F-box domain-containing protein n=1 Tax=Achaetomium macrosporum TaxID=79813 RepID=A0AAN7CGZ6_9PEZI|nr:hypothetical protein C8A03DRAFT_11841 [Achaetomium macrosporum]
MASSTKQEAPTNPPTRRALAFTDLPQEVQREIIKHCSTRDLICVALVSKHFRDLAAAQLYRDFSIVFPDEDNPQFDTRVDSLAGGFDTFVTSDYNYAQYLKILCFDTLYMGDKAEVAYRPYLANLSCGKFMNTLLLLTLRKAKALEAFKWNIRVELSRPVYQELHRIPALSHVHIRLQAGPSQYETPPPLPYNASHSPSPPLPAHVTPVSSIPPPPSFGLIPPPGAPPGPPQGLYVPVMPASAVPLPPLPKPPRPKTLKKAPAVNEPPTLSGFKKLKSLAVLDIDTLDIVPELQACIRNSAGTLRKLKLSFSEKLASSARKPSIDPEPEDSDQDDEMVPPQPHFPNDEVSGPARAFRAQEERKIQESVLGRIFDVEPNPTEKVRGVSVEKKAKKAKVKSERDLIDFMKTIAPKFMGELNGTTDFAPPQDVIDMIGQAAQKYIDEAKSRNKMQGEQPNRSDASSSSASQLSDGKAGMAPAAETSGSGVTLFSDAAAGSKAKKIQRDASPEDIDIEEPEEQLAIDHDDSPAGDASPIDTTGSPSDSPISTEETLANANANHAKALATVESRRGEYNAAAADLEMFASRASSLNDEIRRSLDNNSAPAVRKGLAEAQSLIQEFNRIVQAAQEAVSTCDAAINGVEKLPADVQESVKRDHAHRMRDYLRETRGVALESLSIYLVPVKASVLSRAIDIRVLRRLTLLNVGVQAPIWALLHSENKEAPLPLRKIYTDNVSHTFLNFVSSLKEVHELFLLEREAKAKPESFAPKTHTTIDQIRRMVLKKHLTTLRGLMIKNLTDTAWDLNEKAILLLCMQGKKLEELACNMSIRAMHCLMQHIAGLASLRALHVVHLRNDDTCVWVMRETKRFLIDNVSHYPHLKLEYIAIDEDDRADQLIRVSDWYKDGGDTKSGEGKSAEKEGKGKQKAAGVNLSSLNLGSTSDLDIPAIISAELGEEGSSAGSDDWETDEEGDDEPVGQKIETIDGIPFCDVPGVRIFKKEIVAGRL